MTAEEIKRIRDSYENAMAANSDMAEMEAYNALCKSLGITPEEGEEIALRGTPTIEGAAEQRRADNSKAVDDRHGRDALTLADFAKGFKIKEDELKKVKPGQLSDLLKSKGAMGPLSSENGEQYKARIKTNYENMGLNFSNVEDRKLKAKSLEALLNKDSKDAYAKEYEDSVIGRFSSLVAPRVYEHTLREIQGEENDDDSYIKDALLDGGENLAMTLVSPLRAIKAIKDVKAIKKLYQLLNASRGGRVAAKAAETVGNAAAVPLVSEVTDAVAYGDDNVRGNFEGEDVALGSLVNLATPVILKSQSARSARAAGKEGNEVLQEAAELVKEKIPGEVISWGVNKAGKSSYARMTPIGEEIARNSEERAKEAEEGAEELRVLRSKWEQGLEIPEKGDKNYEKYLAWKRKAGR